MKRENLVKFQSELFCCFCRNRLTNHEIKVLDYQGDFVSVWCKPCEKQYQENNRWGPKYLICLCSEKPKEFEINMAKSEIEQQAKKSLTQDCCNTINEFTMNKINNFDTNIKLESLPVDNFSIKGNNKDENFKDKSTGPRRKGNRKVSNL